MQWILKGFRLNHKTFDSVWSYWKVFVFIMIYDINVIHLEHLKQFVHSMNYESFIWIMKNLKQELIQMIFIILISSFLVHLLNDVGTFESVRCSSNERWMFHLNQFIHLMNHWKYLFVVHLVNSKNFIEYLDRSFDGSWERERSWMTEL